MKRFRITIEWGTVKEPTDVGSETTLESFVDRADPLSRDQPGFGPARIPTHHPSIEKENS